MRVVGGRLKGRNLAAPSSRDIRPTADRLREAVFNILVHAYDDPIENARVLDLFAGTGALGIEALSRGAAECTFVERDRNVARYLRDNIDQLGLAGRSRVVTGDAVSQGVTIDVDLVLADPPYEFEEWVRLLSALRASFVVAEAGRALDALPGLAEAGWEATRSKRYGRTWVTFFERMER
jgi:16S rRNA (guanine966-N2)-methyltransferase